jgi:transposase-like protein
MPRKTTRNHYSPKQKAEMVLEVLREEQTLAQIAAAAGVHINLLRKWKTQAVERLPEVFNTDNQVMRDLETQHEREREELYAEIGRLTTQLVWLKKKSGFNFEK